MRTRPFLCGVNVGVVVGILFWSFVQGADHAAFDGSDAPAPKSNDFAGPEDRGGLGRLDHLREQAVTITSTGQVPPKTQVVGSARSAGNRFGAKQVACGLQMSSCVEIINVTSSEVAYPLLPPHYMLGVEDVRFSGAPVVNFGSVRKIFRVGETAKIKHRTRTCHLTLIHRIPGAARFMFVCESAQPSASL